MKPAFPNLDQFLHAAARRLWLRRAVRRSQPVLFVGSLATFIVAVGGIWIGYSPQSALILLITALIVALFQAWRARPALHAAAVDADRQLNLNDLLATAQALPRSPVDPWHAIILAQADYLCRTLSPANFSPQPISIRCLSVCAALITLTLLMAAIPSNNIHSASSPFATALNFSRNTDFQPVPVRGAGFQSMTSFRRPTDSPSSAQIPQPSVSSISVKIDKKINNTGSKTGFSSQRPPNGAASVSERNHTESLLMRSPLADARGSDPSGKIEAVPVSGTGAQEKSNSAAPIWSPDVPIRSPSGGWSLRPDAIPAAYRDLIRSYFDRK
jgi:hypothetical protein